MNLTLPGWSVCVAVIAAQRGSERHVVPSTLLCRWNTPLLLVDGEAMVKVDLAWHEAILFVFFCWRQCSKPVHVILE